MREIWKDISGFEGMYQVSSLGRIRSVDRVAVVKCRHGGYAERHDKGRVMQPTDNGNGYQIIFLNKNGRRNRFYVHRLVAEVFCENLNVENHVHHKDHNKNNNSSANLEWVSCKENIGHSRHLMRHPKRISKIGKSGEKYIKVNRYRDKQTFSVNIDQLSIHKTFASLADAVEFRDKAVQML